MPPCILILIGLNLSYNICPPVKKFKCYENLFTFIPTYVL